MWELATELYGSDWVNTTKEQLAFWRMRVVINKKNIFVYNFSSEIRIYLRGTPHLFIIPERFLI